MSSGEQLQIQLLSEPRTRLVNGVVWFIGSNLLETLLKFNLFAATADLVIVSQEQKSVNSVLNQVYNVAVSDRTKLNSPFSLLRNNRAAHTSQFTATFAHVMCGPAMIILARPSASWVTCQHIDWLKVLLTLFLRYAKK